MNKNQKIALTAVVAAIVIIALVAAIHYLPSNTPQTNSALIPAGNPPSTLLSITGDVAAERTLSITDLTQMPLASVTSTIDVISSDGFNRTINTYQAYNSTQYPGSEYILAFSKDGQWMDSSEGPLKLITPDLVSSYNVKSVDHINLRPWTITINGSVSNPLVLTGSNITNYEVKTVTAPFAPGGEPQRTSDWTGVSLSSILQASGVSSSASNITITAIDGYSRQYTLAQVQSTGMLVGYKENGSYLSPKDGQPFRLFVPTEDLKWGQNWVRWVSEITVS
jgi:DMSO/TMAO reductase YedYZ molybdopterin-dependent catalytic subunit